MQAKWGIPTVRGNPPCMSFKDIAFEVGLTISDLRVQAAKDKEFPAPVQSIRTRNSNTYYSKPDAVKWIKKYLTSKP